MESESHLELHPLTAAVPGSRGRSPGRLVGRGALWIVAILLGWFGCAVAFTTVSMGIDQRDPFVVAVGGAPLVAGLALVQELRSTKRWVRLLLLSLALLVASPSILIGVLLVIVYPVAALLG